MIEALGDPRFYVGFWLVVVGAWSVGAYFLAVRPHLRHQREMIELLLVACTEDEDEEEELVVPLQ